MTNFPYRKYSYLELLKEYEKLINYQPDKTIRRKNIGYKCSNAFFQYARMNTASQSNLNNIDFWKIHKKKILDYQLKSDKKMDLFGTIQYMNHPPSQFPPNVAIDIYFKFKATKILDPFSGWGDRCIAAIAKNLDYIGIDSNRNLKSPYSEMIQFYPHTSQVRFINKPVEKVDLTKFDFDFVLTSPPFWDESKNLIEHYQDMVYSEYESFMDNVFIPTILKCAQIAKWSCYYIPKYMAKYVSKHTGIKWNKILKYSYSGNKKYQNIYVYCLNQLT